MSGLEFFGCLMLYMLFDHTLGVSLREAWKDVMDRRKNEKDYEALKRCNRERR